MEFRILGSLEIRSDGAVVPVGAPKQRALLISLLLDVGRVVSAERLVDDLWGEDASDRALVSVRSYVSNLRSLLPGGVIATRGRGYLLDVDPQAVDAVRFEALARRGRELVDDEPPTALALLDDALGLWHGPALADVADYAFARGAIARLEELRLATAEDRLAAMLRVGRAAEAVAEAEALVVAAPLRERPRALLMVALYRTGRASEALATHRAYRSLLADEQGLDPGPRLEALADAILRRDPTLDAPASSPASEQMPAAAAPREVGPPAGAAAADDVLVGRSAERARLRRAVDRLASGEGGVILLAGEPGIGKTALLRALASDAQTAGAPVAWGRCHEAEGAPAFWPWLQVVRTLSERLDPVTLAAALAGSAAAVTHLVPELADIVPRPELDPAAGPQTARFVLHDAVATFLRRVAGETGLVVVIDDLHWADVASLELTAFVGSQSRGAGLLLAGSYRHADADRTAALDASLASLAREETAVTLRLAGLSTEDVARLASVVSDAPVDAALAEDMQRRAGGNPFFVRQLAQLHAESSSDSEAAIVPIGVRHVLLRRLQLVPDDVRRTLDVASVLGQDVDARALARSRQLDLPTVLDHLDVAVEHGLLEAGPGPAGFRFLHALIRETLYGELRPSRLGRLHAAAADALEQETLPPVQAIAEHLWLAADLVDADRPVRWFRKAAEEALLVFAHEQAERFLRLALHLLEHRPSGHAEVELEVRVRLVQVLVALHGWSAASIPDVAERARELAQGIGPVPDLTSVWWSWWGYSMTRGAAGDASRRARQLLMDVETLGTPAEVVAGHVAVAYTELFRGAPPETLRLHLEAAAMAEVGADPECLAMTPEGLGMARLVTVGLTEAFHGEPDRASAAVADAIAASRDAGSAFSEAYARMFAGFVNAVLDRPELSRAATEVGLELTSRMSLEHLANLTIPTHAWACARLGDDPAAQAGRITAAIEALVAIGHLHAVPQWQLLLAEVHGLAGDLEAAHASLTASRATAAQVDEVVYGPQWRRVEDRLATFAAAS